MTMSGFGDRIAYVVTALLRLSVLVIIDLMKRPLSLSLSIFPNFIL